MAIGVSELNSWLHQACQVEEFGWPSGPASPGPLRVLAYWSDSDQQIGKFRTLRLTGGTAAQSGRERDRLDQCPDQDSRTKTQAQKRGIGNL